MTSKEEHFQDEIRRLTDEVDNLKHQLHHCKEQWSTYKDVVKYDLMMAAKTERDAIRLEVETICVYGDQAAAALIYHVLQILDERDYPDE